MAKEARDRPSRRRHGGSRLIACLVGLGFLGFAITIAATHLADDFDDYRRMRGWVPVQAEILSVRLKTHTSSDSARSYSVEARYRYTYRGVAYEGHRVGISAAADNIGSYQEDMHRRLSRAQARRRPITVWIDPADPTAGVIDRDLRWGLTAFKSVFVTVFAAVGVLLLVPWRQRPGVALPAAGIGRPARGVAAASPVIKDDRSGRIAWIIALGGLALSAALGPTVVAKFEEEPVILLALIVPLIAVAALISALRNALDLRRFGRLQLVMDPFPGAIGGDVGGMVDVPHRYTPDDRFAVTLTCMRTHVTDGNRGRQEETIVWQETGKAKSTPSPKGTRLAFRFTPPEGLPPSGGGQDDRCHWSIRLEGRLRGADLDRTFTIPVETGTTRSAGGLPEAVVAPDPRAIADLPPGIVRLKRRPDGIELFYPARRHAGSAAMLGIVGLVFAGMATGLTWATIGQPWPVAGFGAIFATVVAAVALAILIIAGLVAGSSLAVRADRSGIDVEHRLFGLRVARQHLLPASIEGFEIDVSGRTTVGRRQTARLRLRAKRRTGKPVTLGDGLPNAQVAEYLRRLVTEACRLE